MTTDDWIKLAPPVFAGGVMGAIVTALITNRRNRIQPISKRITVSSIDIPTIMPGYDSYITLTNSDTGTPHQFAKISTIQLELSNIGNKELGIFDVGVTLPADANIIGVQHSSPGMLHRVTYTPHISIEQVSNQVTFTFEPFNRNDTYNITLTVNYLKDDLANNILLSNKSPIKFVDAAFIDKELATLIRNTAKDYPFSSLYMLPIIIGLKLLARRLK